MLEDFFSLKRYWDSFLRANGLAGDGLFNDFEREHFEFLQRMFCQSKSVPGSLVECGLGYGKSFLILSWFRTLFSDYRPLWGFDSFEGFPAPSLLDDSDRHPRQGEWGRTSIALIKKLLGGAGVNQEGITMAKGFLDDNLPRHRQAIAPIALLHLDLDLHDSYRTALDNLWDIVSPGGIVIFDEYRHPKWPGATIAIDGFFLGKGQQMFEDKASCRHYLIKR